MLHGVSHLNKNLIPGSPTELSSFLLHGSTYKILDGDRYVVQLILLCCYILTHQAPFVNKQDSKSITCTPKQYNQQGEQKMTTTTSKILKLFIREDNVTCKEGK
jgi:hypothetical protein